MEGSLSSDAQGRATRNYAAAVINDAGGNFDVTETIRELECQMLEAANNLEFEKAALFRDQIKELKRNFSGGGSEPPLASGRAVSYRKGRKRG